MKAVIPKVPWTSLDIWSSKGRTFTRPNHFLLDQKKINTIKVQYFILLYIHICKNSFACNDVVALIVIQPFVIGQPLYVKCMYLFIFLILLSFLPLVVTFSGFPFQTFSRNSPGYILVPQHFDFNKWSVKFSHVRFVI